MVELLKSEPEGPAAVDLKDPSLYLNRELSWIQFNQRVLEQARSPETPLLERLKFLSISGTNLDEFFMVRAAGLMQQVAGKIEEPGPDGRTPSAALREIARQAHELTADQYRLLGDELTPALAEAGILLVRRNGFTPEDRRQLDPYFHEQIFPVLTPLAVDPGHPFPSLRNLTLNLAVRLKRRDRAASLGVVQVPSVLARFVPLASPAGTRRLAFLEDVIALEVDHLFPGTQIEAVCPFRITRNWELHFDEEDADDLLEMIEKEVRRRDRGNAVRLEVDESADDALRAELVEALGLGTENVYPIAGPLNLADLMRVYHTHEGTTPGGRGGPEEARRGDRSTRLKDEALVPALPAAVREAERMIPLIARGDLLLHHPYESFDPVVDFVEEAAEDPDVLAIKQTLYRTSGGSSIIKALARAAENRKQVTAIVELKARFDEENNIAWARALEEAGVHVVYGLIGLKTHCKMCLVVRREANGIRRYLHLSTGNYNPSTARLYTDLSLFTARSELCRDASALFNLLTGNASSGELERFSVAPIDLHRRVLERIGEVADAARAGKRAEICAKMNALVDGDVIRALYRASQAGATIELLVRGICCLRPGVPGVSDRIRVRSVVDRFLEHSRIFHFIAGDAERVYLSSADWMPRNFQRRVEVMFPVEEPAAARRLVDEILGTLRHERARSWQLCPDGEWRPFPSGGAAAAGGEGAGLYSPQARFLDLGREAERAPPKLQPVPSLHVVADGKSG